MIGFLIAAVLLESGQGGIELKIESETKAVDPGRSVFLRVELKAPGDRTATLPDLRERTVGFLLAEDFAEEPRHEADGSIVQVANWRLVPEACAPVYKIRPFVVKASPKIYRAQSDEGMYSFVAGPLVFESPAAREPVTGGMECDPEKDLPPLSWRLVGWIVLALVTAAAVFAGIVLGAKYLVRRVREHRMSPIERAWAELDRLLRRGLPGRGRYKDFYVELTMVVRRYIQRKYGIKAPHMTTEEFLRAAKPSDELRRFLESADLVKFAGVEATPEMADGATAAARRYLSSDSREVAK